MNHCVRHYEEPTAAHCRTCQRPFCSRCLVFPFGASKPPFCVSCALSAAGVRNGVKVPTRSAPTAPAIDRKAAKAQRKAEKEAAKAQAKAAKLAARHSAAPEAPASSFDPQSPRPSHVPGPSQLSLAPGAGALRTRA